MFLRPCMMMIYVILSVGCTSSKAEEPYLGFIKEITKNTEFPRGEIPYKKVKIIKNLIKSKMDVINTKKEARQFSHALSKCLLRSNNFQFYDYYILWMGSRVLCKYPPMNKSFIVNLINKVNNRNKIKCREAIKKELVLFTVELLMQVVDIGFSLKEKNKVNFVNWEKFVNIVSANGVNIKYNVSKKKYEIVQSGQSE